MFGVKNPGCSGNSRGILAPKNPNIAKYFPPFLTIFYLLFYKFVIWSLQLIHRCIAVRDGEGSG